ncbi:hypothetical protein Desdi_2223 [Desulfitobacterium dichloroeliminans LMG P-21439]|uniref:Uncharacterized protein n=1 Tax=Desulfitobacterium dichloroeliminans (strain LMG P-21439 / DCA1) TaxID=871963 RepID=L0FAH4_DESDL|nr:hypothetical protein [Desulfitobacterium dichloroeliminans]AGA69656.1 hypothetical protein Desdi_2223 [Desulfitobacterium dichloroeliminans LMG P-21439]
MDKNIELMKKLIEEKKKKSAQQGGPNKATAKIGQARSGIKSYKKGGLFDK